MTKYNPGRGWCGGKISTREDIIVLNCPISPKTLLLSSLISSLVVKKDNKREQTSNSNVKKGLANKVENIIALLHEIMLDMHHEYYLKFWSPCLKKDVVEVESTQTSLLLYLKA